ncbi:MAG: molybdopterin-synthase adenylyltransferase MoeB [Chloroflexota bacterium]|nr:molybdopterin-synthase adenylyltransferase MoeB [Chloroflexota bacterium]
MPTTYRDLLDQVKSRIGEVDASEAQAQIAAGAHAIDVREPDEIAQGVIPGATAIPRGFLEARIEDTVRDRDEPIVVYCAGGARSAFATQSLHDLGYTNVVSLAGGFGGWKSAGLPWTTPFQFSSEQQRRYSRHFLLPEVGEAGQQKLLEAKVLLIGAGGLGSPAALYLAAAGVGTLGIVDDDVVDDSNLQRQILHTTDRIGISKVESARQALTALNPDVTIVAHEERLTRENALTIFKDYYVIVDGADNFATRYLVNDACVLLDKPNVHGSIFRFEGQTTVFDATNGPCYRCLFPDPPPPDLAPNCAEAGVLGVLPGVIGVLQATEAIKLIVGIGKPLTGRLMLYDALDATFREMRLDKDPACPMCGSSIPVSLDDIEYSDIACAIPALASA